MKLFVLSVALLLSAYCNCQTRISDHNDIEWFSTTINKHLGGKFNGIIEYHWRRTNWLKDWQQSELKTAIDYKLNTQINLQLAYTWNKLFPYGEITISPLPKTFPEHIISEQVSANAKVGKSTLTNRLRFDQKWTGRFTDINSTHPDQWVFFTKIRYFTRLEVPVSKSWSASIADEIFIGFGKSTGENVFDQNRLILLAGHNFNPSFRVEAGCISQLIQLGREISNKNVFQYNSGLIVNTIFLLK
ncbi:MAG: hypothetical protein JWN76_2507 [Chitinophagaceae bacterium]|nr:hypothetical protein [Chitinophagaceae bacterium]